MRILNSAATGGVECKVQGQCERRVSAQVKVELTFDVAEVPFFLL